MQVVAIILAVVAGVGAMVALFKPLFGDKDELLRCIKFWLTPDIVSLFRGQYGEDRWAEMKLGLWLVAGGICGAAAYFGTMKLFGG